jgi:hypothetical protein
MLRVPVHLQRGARRDEEAAIESAVRPLDHLCCRHGVVHFVYVPV